MSKELNLFDIDQTPDSLARTATEQAFSALSHGAEEIDFSLLPTIDRDMTHYPNPNRPQPKNFEHVLQEYRRQQAA